MEQLTEAYNLRLTKTQKSTLDKLDEMGFCPAKFIRLAIKEKMQRDVRKERKLFLKVK